VRRIAPCLLAVLALATSTAGAAPIHLEDGVAFLDIDPESQDGLTAWTVNGVQHVRTQWFWLGGAGQPETSLDSVHSVATPSDVGGDGHDDALDVAFDGQSAVYLAQLRWSLTGSAPNVSDPSAFSELSIELTIQATQGPLHLRLFQYTDVDLFGSYADDEALFAGATATVTDATALGSWASSWDVAPTAFDAAVYDATLASLNDGAATVLGDAGSASGDVTIAAMWDFELPAGGVFTLRQTQTIRVVPEPGVALLLALGLAGLAARRQGVTR
jgi:hypothetical protein